MSFRHLTAIVAILALSTACSDGSDRSAKSTVPEEVTPARPTLDLTFSTPPIDLPGITVDFAKDVAYGEGERNVFDIYLPDCDGPSPLVVYIHGGGFTGGDKERTHEQNAPHIEEFLQDCVAYATINYFLLTVPEEGSDPGNISEQGGVLTSLQDTARAIQFMRYYFESLGIDPENIAAYGASAGAGSSLWLGTHDDMAEPDSSDPVLRESTRLSAVGALATQSTYDLMLWGDILLPITQPFAEVLGGTDIISVASAVGASNYLLTFLGVDSIDEIDSQANIDYRANVDMLELMDSGDAPIYVHNFDTGFDDLLNTFLHHGLHAIAVKDRADEVGLASVAYVEDPTYGLADPSEEGLVSFLTRHIR